MSKALDPYGSARMIVFSIFFDENSVLAWLAWVFGCVGRYLHNVHTFSTVMGKGTVHFYATV